MSNTAEKETKTVDRPRWLFGRAELIIVILLGLVSMSVAYASFESSLYGGNTSADYSKGNNLRTEAESLYLEGNQQYTQDSATLQQLAVLKVAADAGDATAQAQYDQLYFIGVSDDLDKAFQKAAQQDIDDPKFYHDPQADKDYQASLFDAYGKKLDKGVNLVKQGDKFNNYGDQLTLSTVLMALTLFLLGVAAVVRKPRTKLILGAIGMVIFVGAAIFAATIPFIWLG